jgi:putative ABC transport system substrate-binding protein
VRRRDFLIGLLLTTNTASTDAQQKPKVYRLAVVDPISPVTDLAEDAELPYYRGFYGRLRQNGFVEGQNLEIYRYSGEGYFERFGDVVTEAILLMPDAIFLVGTRLLLALKGATTSIPIVAIMVDPVRYGLAVSLARPGRNITGVAYNPGHDLYEKRFKFLKEVVPNVSKIGILASRTFIESTAGRSAVAERKEAARRAGIELVFPIEAVYWSKDEYRAAFAHMVREGVDRILVTEQNENWTYRRSIIAFANEFRLPAIYPDRMFVELGGLMSFGPAWIDFGKECGRIVSEVFNGANPANIPISQPTKYELSLNLMTARHLGINIPPSLLARADLVIE